jgi:glycosyltransferase involved in cell wall biosynthesis
MGTEIELNQPRISVVIPAYNAAGTIAETIASVLAQTLTDFEIVVIDDGSSDRTWAMLQTLAEHDRRVRPFRFANGGQAIARNRGIARARGQWIAFLDADDRWTPDKLAAQLAALMANPAAALAYSWTDYVDDRGTPLHRGSYVQLSGAVLGPLLQVNFLENGSNPLVCRSALAALGWPAIDDPQPIAPFDPTLVPSEDWDLWLRLAARFPFVCVPRVQVLYRVAAASQSANVVRIGRSGFACLQRALDRTPELATYRDLAWGNFAKYLLYKYLAPRLDSVVLRSERRSPRQRRLGWYLWWRALRHDPAFGRSRGGLKSGLGLMVITIVPDRGRVALLDRLGRRSRWLDPRSILGYIRRPPDPSLPPPSIGNDA